MRSLLILIPILALLAAGCEKKRPAPVPEPTKAPAAASQPSAPQPSGPKMNVPRPRNIPRELADLVQAKWPEIEKEGKKFEEQFRLASAARRSGDRAALSKAIEAASNHYDRAKELWAEVAYWPTNQLDDGKIDERTYNLCEVYLKTWSRRVHGWDKKAKGLKELSTVR